MSRIRSISVLAVLCLAVLAIVLAFPALEPSATAARSDESRSELPRREQWHSDFGVPQQVQRREPWYLDFGVTQQLPKREQWYLDSPWK